MERDRLEKMAEKLFGAFLKEMTTKEISAISLSDLDAFKTTIQNRVYHIAPVEGIKVDFKDQLRGMEELVFPYLMKDQKIPAIKKLREETRWGLKESKEYCDALQVKMAKAGLIELPSWMKGKEF